MLGNMEGNQGGEGLLLGSFALLTAVSFVDGVFLSLHIRLQPTAYYQLILLF